MTEITALRVNPRRPATVEVFIDGTFWRAIPSTNAGKLRVGMALAAKDLADLEGGATESEALETIGRLLARRPHSEAEARRRMQRAGFDEAVIGRTLARLGANGDLDDAAFARAWVENRKDFRPRSAAMIRSELRAKGVAAEAIESALAGFDEDQAAEAAARRAARRWTGLDAADRRRKISGHLARKGFDYDTIRSAVHRLEATAEVESEERP